MVEIDKRCIAFEKRLLLNGYSITNEMSFFTLPVAAVRNVFAADKMYLDDNYGRFYSGDKLNNSVGIYGNPLMPFYNHGGQISLPVVDVIHVPYRKIPVYKANSLGDIAPHLEKFASYSPNHTILLRGQNTFYQLQREDPKELIQLYYNTGVKEPSFLPSMTRRTLNYYDTVSVWHNIAAMLLQRLKDNHPTIDEGIRLSERFHLFSLAVAQHYGLPSVGLDLTDDLAVALWFALYEATYSSTEPVKAELIPADCNTANIYVFRCDKRTYFKFEDVVGDIGINRPSAQHAYFNHCGWGMQRNQMALQLMCAFRVNQAMAKELPSDFIRTIFPRIEDDEVLRVLLDIKDLYKETSISKLLEGLYL